MERFAEYVIGTIVGCLAILFFLGWIIKRAIKKLSRRVEKAMKKFPYSSDNFSFIEKKEAKTVKHLNEGVDFKVL